MMTVKNTPVICTKGKTFWDSIPDLREPEKAERDVEKTGEHK